MDTVYSVYPNLPISGSSLKFNDYQQFSPDLGKFRGVCAISPKYSLATSLKSGDCVILLPNAYGLIFVTKFCDERLIVPVDDQVCMNHTELDVLHIFLTYLDCHVIRPKLTFIPINYFKSWSRSRQWCSYTLTSLNLPNVKKYFNVLNNDDNILYLTISLTRS